MTLDQQQRTKNESMNKKLNYAIFSILAFGVMGFFVLDYTIQLVSAVQTSPNTIDNETLNSTLLEIKEQFDTKFFISFLFFLIGILILFFNDYREKWYFWTLAILSITYLLAPPSVASASMFINIWIVLLVKRREFFKGKKADQDHRLPI